MSQAQAPTVDLNHFKGFDKQLVIDTLEDKVSYLITSGSGAQIRVSVSAYQLLQAVNSGHSFAEIAQEINKQNSELKVTAEQLEDVYKNIAAKLARIEERAAKFKLPWAFWIKLKLIPGTAVRRISSILAALYSPFICGLLLGLIVLSGFLFFKAVKTTVDDNALLWGYLLYFSSLIFHEFGHSSACARYGAPPSEIGFTIYLIYPAFYSDVSAAWQLSRWRRVVVDLGGNYFQCVAASFFTLGFYVSHWAALRVASILVLYTCIFSLNPFFKYDGYWVAADMLGVTNLASQPARIGKYILARVLKRPAESLPWPLPVTVILVFYSVITTAVWSIFVWRLLPLLRNRIILLHDQLPAIAGKLALRQLPTWAELRPLVVSAPMLLISVVLIWNLCSRIVRWVVSRSKRTGETGSNLDLIHRQQETGD